MRDEIPPEVPTYHLFTPPTDKAVAAERSRAWSGDTFSFHDVLDIVNPLQHLPIISTVYRYLTGDQIGAIPRIVGDSLYGGPLGLLSGLVDATIKKESGEDMGEHMVALATGTEGPSDAPATAVAAAGPASDKAGVPASAAIEPGAGPVASAAVTATSPIEPAARQPVALPPAAPPGAAAVPVSGATTMPGAIPLTPATKAAMTGADPRQIFMARADAFRRQYSGGGTTVNNRVVPLQGIGVPAGYGQPRQRPPIPAAAAAAAAAATVPTTTPAGDAPAGTAGGSPAGLPASGAGNPPGITLTGGTALAPSALPSNPPINISQQMLDALDKYARLQQQRGPQQDSGRGGQVNVMQ